MTLTGDLLRRQDTLSDWDALTRSDDLLASWAFVTVDPGPERNPGQLAGWALEVCDYPVS